jgi:ferredoxin/flavodoxin---NADP+ reductase
MRCFLLAKEKNKFLVAVIGAGPAGLFASRYLARQGVQVVLFNRDIKPGGLAEYGIFPDKYKMRNGLMSQFKRILEIPSVRYQGNVKIGKSGDIELDQLRQAGFQALMVTTGAQQNNWLGLPGEDLDGVYQANDIVFHYNHLPERPEFEFKVGRKVVVIGVGNVMLDIVHYLKKSHIPCTVTAYARRGPTEVKFDQQTLEPVASCLDLQAIQAAVDGARPDVESVGNNVNEFYVLLEKARMKAKDCDSDLQFQMRFLCSPRRLVGDEHGRVREIVFELNHLVQKDDQIESRGSGVLETVAADTVIFSVGSRVDDGFGLPVAHGNFVTNPEPRFPVDGISYEVYNPDLCARCEDIFVSGWARSAGEGIVGLARKDAERGAKAVLGYLDSLDPFVEISVDAALERLPALDKTIVDLADLEKIWNAEQKIADERGLPAFKFHSQKALLRVIKES